MKLAVYGTLKRGYSNHYLLKECRYLGRGSFKGNLHQIKGLNYPIATEGDRSVNVELYEIDSPNIIGDIHLMELTCGFIAKKVRINGGEAWVYLIPLHRVVNFLSSRTLIKSGNWLE